jgi:nitrate reductase NapD
MIQKPLTPEVGRREFLRGHWTLSEGDTTSSTTEIASVLVQVRPARLEAVAVSIETVPGAEIYSRDARGKLVVVIEASDVGAIGAALNTISSMPGVLTAALVFHGSDVD